MGLPSLMLPMISELFLLPAAEHALPALSTSKILKSEAGRELAPLSLAEPTGAQEELSGGRFNTVVIEVSCKQISSKFMTVTDSRL